jgi:hypothetical protein
MHTPQLISTAISSYNHFISQNLGVTNLFRIPIFLLWHFVLRFVQRLIYWG